MLNVRLLSCVQLFETTWTVAYHTPPYMGFSRQEYLSGLPFPSPEDLPDQGIELASPAWQADSLLLSPWRSSFLCACILQNSISVYRHTKAKILFLLCSKVSHPGGKHQAPIHRPSRGLIGKANGALKSGNIFF